MSDARGPRDEHHEGDGGAAAHPPRGLRGPGGLLERLIGLETEYAVRSDLPNDLAYERIVEVLGRRVRLWKGPSFQRRFFWSTGGSVAYEALPHAYGGGLVECATPECRSPTDLVTCQRAQDELLEDVLADLARRGHDIGLLKNCRDARGHLYGAQENYDAELASGWRLALWRAGVLVSIPLFVAAGIVTWLVLLLIVVAVTVGGFLALFGLFLAGVVRPRGRARRFLERMEDDRVDGWVRRLLRPLGYLELALTVTFWQAAFAPISWLLRALGFGRYRPALVPFLASRCIVTGAGTVREDGAFALSEKGLDVGALVRIRPIGGPRPVFDTGNLLKCGQGLAIGRPREMGRLFRRVQRMQLGYSDSNLCDVAELLKVGTTSLVLDLIERGALADAPRLAQPVAAIRALASDPTLRMRVPLVDGRLVTALELQRFYRDRVAEHVLASRPLSLEALEIVRLWGEVLDLLEEDPGRLVGRLDWVTKRYLLESVGDDVPPGTWKKVDLKYHELGTGYLRALDRAGRVLHLVQDEDIERARREPPAGTRAAARVRFLETLGADPGVHVRVAWDSVRIGRGLKGRTVRLDRRRPDASGPTDR